MKKTVIAVALLALALPASASAQLSVGARAGTLGVGGEVSFGITRMLAVRAGLGVVPYEYNDEISNLNYNVSPPDRMWNVGVDVYPFGGGLRVSAGMLNRPQFEMNVTGQQTANVGGRQYTGNINIDGSFTNERETAPYATIGFGRATGRGLGFFFDVGAAFMGNATVQLTGNCTEATTGQPCPEFDSRLAAEEAEAQQAIDDLGSYVKVHPILQIGLRIGF
jgi:hypothetical protein